MSTQDSTYATLQYQGQIQMIQSLQQQTSMFSTMNNLLSQMNMMMSQLNAGFRALTQAIMVNTRTLGQLAISPKSYLLSQGPHNYLPRQDEMPSREAALKFNMFTKSMDVIAQQLQGIIGKLGPTATLGTLKTNLKTIIPQWADSSTPSGAFGFPSTSPYVTSGNMPNIPIPDLKNRPNKYDNSTSGEGLQVLGNLLKMVGSGAGHLLSPLKKLGGEFGGQFKTMGKMALVMAPMQALIGGILEPFEPLTEIFGMFGEMIGIGLLPIVQALIPALMSFVPLFQYFGYVCELITPALTPIIDGFMALGNVLSGKISFDDFLTTIKGIPLAMYNGIVASLSSVDWSSVWTSLKAIGGQVGQAILAGLVGIGDMIKQFVLQVLSGGGADKNIWTLGD